MKWRLLRIARRCVGWIAAAAALYLAAHTISWDQWYRSWASLDLRWFLLAVAADLGVLLTWTAQWRVFLPSARTVKFTRMFEVTALTAAAGNTLPFPGGQAVGAMLLVKRAEVETQAAVSVVVLDQLAEGFGKTALILVTATLAPIPVWMRQAIVVTLPGTLALALVLLACAHLSSRLSRPRGKLQRLIAQARDGLQVLRRPEKWALVLGLALTMKAGEVALVVCVQRSMGVNLPLEAALLVTSGVMVATMVPIAPANLGVYEAAVALVYQYLGLTADVALALAVVQHSVYLAPKYAAALVVLTIGSVSATRSMVLDATAHPSGS